VLRLGQAFVNKEAPGVPSHLWMVLSDPARDPRIVIANLTSKRSDDRSVGVVRTGEHKYVSHDSVIAMKAVRVTTAAALEAARAKGLLSPTADLTPGLLSRVQKAVGASPLVVNEAKEILRTQGFAEGSPPAAGPGP
jgi:hypothetical protein